MRRSAGRQSFERAHVDADQLVGRKAHEISERAVNAQNVVLLIVHHNEVADRVEDLQPVPVGLLHPGKQTGIFQSDAGVTGDGPQQLVIFSARRAAAIGQTQDANEFSRGTCEPDQSAIRPPEVAKRVPAPKCRAGAKEISDGYLGSAVADGLIKAAEQSFILDFSMRRTSVPFHSPRSGKD